MRTEIEWVKVSDRMPKIGDPEYDGKDVDGTCVLFIWDGDIYTGWPVGDGSMGWEMVEYSGMGVLHNIKYWARIPELPKE